MIGLDGDALRVRFNKRFLTEFRKNTLSEGGRIIALECFTIAASIALTLAVLSLNVALGLCVYLIATLMIGMRFRCFNNIIHECSHRAFVDDRDWNDRIGRGLCIVLLHSLTSYRRDHLSHHRFTGDYIRDLEFADTKKFGFHEPLKATRWVYYLKPKFIPLVLKAYTGRKIFVSDDGFGWNIARLVYLALMIAALIGAIFLNPIALIVVLFWIIPLITTLPLIGYLSDIMDHAGLLESDNEIDKSRNYISENTLLQWLFFPRNDSYHLLHHLFPTVPTRFFPQCHRILMSECPEYAARKHSFVEWLNDFRKPDPIARPA